MQKMEGYGSLGRKQHKGERSYIETSSLKRNCVDIEYRLRNERESRSQWRSEKRSG